MGQKTAPDAPANLLHGHVLATPAFGRRLRQTTELWAVAQKAGNEGPY
jgi:hypothetical protein